MIYIQILYHNAMSLLICITILSLLEVIIMTKSYIKRCFIILLLICFSFHSLSAATISTTSIDNALNTSYDTLLNIQNQFKALTRNSFVNIVNNTSNTANKNQLDAFSNQLTAVKNDLNSLSAAPLTSSQNAKLQTLLTIASYLTYIQDRNYDFLASVEPSEQYTLLNSIFIGHSLITQLFSYLAAA
mgnify:CR=1 FL=1